MPNICHLSVPKSSADRFPEYVNSNRRVLYNKSRFLDLSSSSSIIVSFHCWRVPFCHMENILNKPCRKWYLRRSPRTGQKTCKVIRVPEGYAPSTHPLPAPSGYLPLLGFYPLSASKRWKIIIPSESGTQRWYPEVSSRQSSRPQGCPQGSPQGSPQGLKAVLREVLKASRQSSGLRAVLRVGTGLKAVLRAVLMVGTGLKTVLRDQEPGNRLPGPEGAGLPRFKGQFQHYYRIIKYCSIRPR